MSVQRTRPWKDIDTSCENRVHVLFFVRRGKMMSDNTSRSSTCDSTKLPEIGAFLTGFGVLFTLLGILFLFDRAFLALGNVPP
jgi:hypothetical protein